MHIRGHCGFILQTYDIDSLNKQRETWSVRTVDISPTKHWTGNDISFASLDGTLKRKNFATSYSSFVGFTGSSCKVHVRNCVYNIEKF